GASATEGVPFTGDPILPRLRLGDSRREFATSVTVGSTPIREQWDQLVRIASSLRQRTAPAHMVVQRLAGSSPSDRVARALTALGRAVKTISILRYLHEEELRRDRKSTRLNSSHVAISYAVFCLKKQNHTHRAPPSPAPAR